jgi:hypothetical protein
MRCRSTTCRVHNAVTYKGCNSQLTLALWTEDYEEYLADLNERCPEIWEKPQSEPSITDKLYLGQHCPPMPGSTKTAGRPLDDAVTTQALLVRGASCLAAARAARRDLCFQAGCG